MIIAKDGKSIQASKFSCEVSPEVHHRAQHVGPFMSDGFKEAIALNIGLEITGASTYRGEMSYATGNIVLNISSDWVPPIRR